MVAKRLPLVARLHLLRRVTEMNGRSLDAPRAAAQKPPPPHGSKVTPRAIVIQFLFRPKGVPLDSFGKGSTRIFVHCSPASSRQFSRPASSSSLSRSITGLGACFRCGMPRPQRLACPLDPRTARRHPSPEFDGDPLRLGTVLGATTGEKTVD